MMEPLRTSDRNGGWSRRIYVGLLLMAVLMGFLIRLSGLGRIGLAEDEVNKIVAVRQYQQGDFTGNSEHPLLMKGLILVSVTLTDAWNRWSAGIPGAGTISEEVAVRLPNVLVGALTAIPLFLVGSLFFSRRVGLLAALLWTTGVHAVFINRVAKEDTLLVFFLLWGLYFHGRMKTMPDSEAQKKMGFYLASAASFGLLLASKYFPHFQGLTLLFFYLHRKYNPEQYPPDRYGKKELLLYLAVTGLVFLLVNPMILHPKVLAHIFLYTEQGTVTHHGYLLADQLYPNSITLTPFGGTPWYFYLLALAVKLPLLVIAAFFTGLAVSFRRWRERGAFFILFWLVFWLAPYSIVGVKFLRYILSLMPAVYLAAAFGTFALLDWLIARLHRAVPPSVRWAAGAAAAALLMLVSLSSLQMTSPYYSMYVNALGGGPKRITYYFPHDECYDLEMREAIAATVRRAPPDSVIAGETPAVFQYYLARYRRPDIQVVNLSDKRFSFPVTAPVFVFLQPGRIYYENIPFHSRLWNSGQDLLDLRVRKHPVVRVFQVDGSAFRQLSAMRHTPPPRLQVPQAMYFLMTGKEGL